MSVHQHSKNSGDVTERILHKPIKDRNRYPLKHEVFVMEGGLNEKFDTLATKVNRSSKCIRYGKSFCVLAGRCSLVLVVRREWGWVN